jgi:bacterioferritin-associated ferredoxin
MIVCVCNRLNQATIRGAIARGAASPDQVYAGCGVNRKCGTCHETIEDLLQQAREAELQLIAAE